MSDRAPPPSSAAALRAEWERINEPVYDANGNAVLFDDFVERLLRAVEAGSPPQDPPKYDFSGGKLPPLTDALVKDWHDQVGAAPAPTPEPPQELLVTIVRCVRQYPEADEVGLAAYIRALVEEAWQRSVAP